MPKALTPELIMAAKNGDNRVLDAVAKYFKPYITKIATRPLYDEYGNEYQLVDNAVYSQIETRLLFQIVYSFDPYKVPDGMELPKD